MFTASAAAPQRRLRLHTKAAVRTGKAENARRNRGVFLKNIKSKVREQEKIEENKRKQEDSTSILNFFQKTVDRGGLFDYNNTCCFR